MNKLSQMNGKLDFLANLKEQKTRNAELKS